MTTHEIKMCPVCLGVGHLERREREDYHHRIDLIWDETCKKCKGSGRILVTTTITEEPYSSPEMRQKDAVSF